MLSGGVDISRFNVSFNAGAAGAGAGAAGAGAGVGTANITERYFDSEWRKVPQHLFCKICNIPWKLFPCKMGTRQIFARELFLKLQNFSNTELFLLQNTSGHKMVKWLNILNKY